jgi:hypothetical protein
MKLIIGRDLDKETNMGAVINGGLNNNPNGHLQQQQQQNSLQMREINNTERSLVTIKDFS